FADALLLMPKFASTIKSLLVNKHKIFEIAKVQLNENCSAMLLKKLPEKLGDPGISPVLKESLRMYLSVGNKMHKAFPLPEESSHWQYKFPLPVKVVPTARRLEMPLPGVCTAIEEMTKKLAVKDRWQLH
nr:reverse transcriptase domain-containing protein [Tanacetum cinerariifolium]